MSRTREHVLHLTPADAGRALEHEDYERAEYAPGYLFELVAGRLAVTPAPNMPHTVVQAWILERLIDYARQRPDVLQAAVSVSRVLTRALGAMTDVQPDVAAYRAFPRTRTSTWHDVAPALVVEVISASDPDKDLVRNRDIYLRVPSIQEYWIVDPRPANGPSMTALARGPQGWEERLVAPGATYRTDLLPGLTLDLGAVFTD